MMGSIKSMIQPFVGMKNSRIKNNNGLIYGSLLTNSDLETIYDLLGQFDWIAPESSNGKNEDYDSSGILSFESVSFDNNEVGTSNDFLHLIELNYHRTRMLNVTSSNYESNYFKEGCIYVEHTALSIEECKFNNNEGSFIFIVI